MVRLGPELPIGIGAKRLLPSANRRRTSSASCHKRATAVCGLRDSGVGPDLTKPGQPLDP